jgi:ribonuclease H / adenosylcobalamin/alpha-ribazole phosphatase
VTSLFVMRHGQTAASVRAVHSTNPGLPLTREGRRQAARAAERLRDIGLDAIRSSPFDRARETAEAVADATGLSVELDDRLREIDYGILEGLSRDEARDRLGAVYTNWRERPFGAEPPGVEPLEQALLRARAAVGEAIATSSRPLLVAHQGILRLVLIALGEIKRDQYFETRLPEAEPIEVDVDGSPLP